MYGQEAPDPVADLENFGGGGWKTLWAQIVDNLKILDVYD